MIKMYLKNILKGKIIQHLQIKRKKTLEYQIELLK